MKFSGDDRGVVIQIGAVLLLAAIVIAMAGYQATVVPDQNNEVEFNHNQEVQGQLHDLRNSIVSTPGGGSGGSHTVSLGTTYPARTLFLNPSPPSGQLRTVDAGVVRIENATPEVDELDDYWNGSGHNWSTSRLEYKPGYSEYDDAPTTIYEHTTLYNDNPHGDSTGIAGQQLLQDGETITIVTLRGDLQKSSSSSVSVDARALSSSKNTVPVKNTTGGNITITLSSANPTYWEGAVDKSEVDGVHDVNVSGGNVTIELEEGSYDLRMAEVGIGEVTRRSPVERAAYVVPIDKSAPTVVAEVRDEFNNPVAGAPVSVTGGNATRSRTDSDGRIVIKNVKAGDEVNVSVAGANVDAEFTVEEGSSSGGNGGNNAYSVLWKQNQTDEAVNVSDSSATLFLDKSGDNDTPDGTATFELHTDPPADSANVDYWISDERNVVESFTGSGETNGAGESSTDVTINTSTVSEGDSFTLGAWSGSGGDSIEVTVKGVEEAAATPVTFSGPTNATSNRNGNEVSSITFRYGVSNPEGANYGITFRAIDGNDGTVLGERGPEERPPSPQTVDGFSKRMNQGGTIDVEMILDDEYGNTQTCTGTVTDRNQEVILSCD